MPRPSKTAEALKGHKTKAELEARKEAEQSLLTGVPISERKEIKKDKSAHSEFQRIIKLFETLKKNDALYTSVINRYCILYSECTQFEKLKNEYAKAIEEISMDKELIVKDYVSDPEVETISLTQYYKIKNNFSKTILSLDSAIMSKRKMMFDIEKENLMTVASGLRTIPKTPPAPAKNPLMEILNDGTN